MPGPSGQGRRGDALDARAESFRVSIGRPSASSHSGVTIQFSRGSLEDRNDRWPRSDTGADCPHPSAGLDEGPHQLPRIDPGLAESGELQRAVALGQATAVGGHGQRDVAESRLGPAERPVEEDLSRRAGHEVGAADDLVDAHRGVVDHDGELIGRADVRGGQR